METQILEGTFMEVQRRLSALPFAPEARLRVIVTEPETTGTAQATFAQTELQNGLPLLPRRDPPEPVSAERVKRPSEDLKDDHQEMLRDRLQRLAAASGRISGPSLPAEALRRENLYEERP